MFNRYTTLAEFPHLPPSSPRLPIKLITITPFEKGSTSSSSAQTKENYAMKVPETFAQVVDPAISVKETQNPRPSPKEEKFEFTTSQVLPILPLDKNYEGHRIDDLTKPCFMDSNFVDTKNLLKNRRYFEAILVDTDSIIMEHSIDSDNPKVISYSKFTIKRILTRFEWFTDHPHTPITLSMVHRPQTYNWFDYKDTWFNFIYLRSGHTWFVKYCPEMVQSVIPIWF